MPPLRSAPRRHEARRRCNNDSLADARSCRHGRPSPPVIHRGCRALDRRPTLCRMRRLPGHDATELERLLFAQSGVLTWQQAVAEVGRGRAERALATKHWRRVCRGVIVTHTGDLTADQQLWVAVLAAGHGAVLAGLTAAVAGGLRRLRSDDPIRIIVPAKHARPDLRRRLPIDMPSVLVHRMFLPDEHVQVGRPMRTTMPRAVVDAAGWARTDDEARTIVAAACQQRLVTPHEILSTVDALPRARRRRLVRTTADDAAGGAQALSEINFVSLCRKFGLPRPALQEKRRDAAGRTRYLDAYWQEWRLHVEVDGAHHMDARQWEADMRRHNDLWIAGDRVLRVSAAQIRATPAAVATILHRALTAAGWRG